MPVVYKAGSDHATEWSCQHALGRAKACLLVWSPVPDGMIAPRDVRRATQEADIEVLIQDSRTYWFNASSLEAEDEFMLIGLVLGLAVYNAVLLDFPLPIALYRKLLGQPTALRDLKEMDPPLGKSLQQLLDMQGESKPSLGHILWQ